MDKRKETTMNRWKFFTIIVWTMFLIGCAFVGWVNIDSQRKMIERINKLEERQEIIKRAVEEHLDGVLNW